MGKKTLTNSHCLLELTEKAQAGVLKAFSGLPECQALARGFDWPQDDGALPAALVEHIKHLRKEQRDPAEREALRVLRLASPRGSAILATVAEQLNDNDLIALFLSQDGGEIGRSVWMRTHSDESARLRTGMRMAALARPISNGKSRRVTLESRTSCKRASSPSAAMRVGRGRPRTSVSRRSNRSRNARLAERTVRSEANTTSPSGIAENTRSAYSSSAKMACRSAWI